MSMRIAYAAMSYTCGLKHLCGHVRYVLAAKIRYRNIFNPCLSKIGQKGAKIGKNSLKKAQNVFVLNHSDMLATKKIRHMAWPFLVSMECINIQRLFLSQPSHKEEGSSTKQSPYGKHRCIKRGSHITMCTLCNGQN